MFSRVWVIAAVSCLLLPTMASGAIYTSNGDFQLISPQDPDDPPINDIIRLNSSTGNVYTNQFDGSPFAVGSEVRTVTVQRFLSAHHISPIPEEAPISLPNGSFLLVFSALRGTVVVGGATPVVLFTEGRSFASGILDTTYNSLDPATWADEFDARFAEYALKPQEDVIPTPFGSPLIAPAPLTNLSAANTIGGPIGDAFILFREDSTAAQNAAGAFGIPAGSAGDDFLSNVDNVAIPPASAWTEAIISTPQQTVDTTGVIGSGFDDADLAVLNAIAMAAFGEVFATGLGPGLTSNYNVAPGTIFLEGDFGGTLTGAVHVGQQVIPEPSMLLVFGGLFWLVGLLKAIRR